MAAKRGSKAGAASRAPSPQVRIGRLDTSEGVRRELDRLYRAARRNAGAEPDAATAAKLAYLLQTIGRVIDNDVADRLARVEEQLKAQR